MKASSLTWSIHRTWLQPLLLFIALLGYFSYSAAEQATSTPQINLDTLQQQPLLNGSYYLLDPEAHLDHAALPPTEQWQQFSRDQLRFGPIPGVVWIKSHFQTSGSQNTDHESLLQFHRLIDFVTLWVYEDGQLKQHDKMGAFTHLPIPDTLNSNKNVSVLKLKANKQYTLLIKLQGHNAVTGTMELWDLKHYHSEDQIVLYFFIAYAAGMLGISLFNLAAFYSTRFKAFLYHAFYGFSILLFQASQYGFIDALLQNDHQHRKEMLIIFSVCCTYASVLAFISTLLELKRDIPVFHKAHQFLVGYNLLILLALPFIAYQNALLLVAAGVFVGVLNGLLLFAYLLLNKDSKALTMALVLGLFAPSSVLLTASRLGWINHNFFTEYLLLLMIIVEMMMISGLLFVQIRKMQQIFWRSQFLDPGTGLPNVVAMRKQLNALESKQQDFALNYLWLGGLEKMNLSRSGEAGDKYLHQTTQIMEKELQRFDLLLHPTHKSEQIQNLFHCDKNTIGIITQPLDTLALNKLNKVLLNNLDESRKNSGYNMELQPVLASCNADQAQGGIERLIQNTTLTLMQCVRHNEQNMLYSEEVGDIERRQIILLNEFETALQQQQFFLLFQPQIDSKTQKLCGLEALVRWKHPQFGLISPVDFIPLLEQNFKITPLSFWVIEQVFEQAPNFIRQYPDIDLSINLSVFDLTNADLPDKIHALLQQKAYHNIQSHIVFEVTESLMMEDTPIVQANFTRLQEMGFRLSIDDFGAGYTSLSYLQTLPADELKIDRRYTQRCLETNSQAIIQSIIFLAQSLNILVVVEGIETEEQQRLFTQWGAHRLQGWKLGKPMPALEVCQQFSSSNTLAA